MDRIARSKRHHTRASNSVGRRSHAPNCGLSNGDVFDALTSERCYHEAMPAALALRKLYEWSRFHFRPALVQDFMRCIGIYPTGTLVQLASGRLGVVFEPNPGKPLLPKVNVFFNIRSNVYMRPEVVDLALPQFAGWEKIVGHESPKKWNVDPLRFMPA